MRDARAFGEGGSSALEYSVQLEYIDGWAHPEADELIWERERDARVVSSLALPEADNPDSSPEAPERLQAFLDANRWTATNRLRMLDKDGDGIPLVSPWHSAVQIEDYQLYPVWKALLMPRVALLLADDVGLGKTIEAGMIVSELFTRRRIRRVMVLCPASLQQQWQDELREKFHLDFQVVDRDSTLRLQRELGLDSNPWATYPRVITSMDYLRQRDITESFRSAADGLGTPDRAVLPWQMLIVDEAHNLTPAMWGDDSDRCQMLRQISPHFEHRLFLTATPHNGYTLSFTGLLELMDPVRFRQTPEMDEQDRSHVQLAMVRRLKREIPKKGDAERFAPRKPPVALAVSLRPDERELFEALRSYRAAALQILAGEGARERHIGEFLFTVLTKRLLSCSYAFARTWWQHVTGLGLELAATDEVRHAQGRAESDLSDDAEKGQREEDALRRGGAWFSRHATQLAPEIDRVEACLKSLGWTRDVTAAGPAAAAVVADAKWDSLRDWIDENLMVGGRPRDDERLIVFTEYKDTLDYLRERMRHAGLEVPVVDALYGGMPAQLREQIKDAFNDFESPLRILLATDTASEGINLQATCRYVIHQEIPWNPMRLEQRNGRVDRHGQARDVYVHHFTCDDEADLKFLSRVVEKVEQAREDLGSVGQVIDQAIMTHFTRREVSLDELDESIQSATQDAPDDDDTQTRDAGAADKYAHVLQLLRATELRLGMTPANLARLLQEAARLEDGRLVELEPEASTYRFQPVPPGWRALVDETLKVKRGPLAGALPRLVFDPAFFEKVENGRLVYRTRPDTALIRLGHPVMRRALGTLRRCMWERERLSRWTIETAVLPPGMEKLLILHLLLEATNGLRETIHQDVLTIPFQVSGDHLSPVTSELWSQIQGLPRQGLSGARLGTQVGMIRDQWHSHRSVLERTTSEKRAAFSAELREAMGAALQEEREQQSALFADRLRELDAQRRPKAIERLRRRVEGLCPARSVRLGGPSRVC